MTGGYATDNDILEVVDALDRVIGTATRREIHERGLLHRAVHIFVLNHSGEIYVQRRSSSKDRHPDKLDSSAAGHVDPGESYETAAVRELREELGISAAVRKMLQVDACPETDNEHVVLFDVRTDVEPRPAADEIQWGAFMEPHRLTRQIEDDPGDFVPAFTLLWSRYLKERP